jgi:DNA (cytosine-5)-methyltransferase 1
MLTYGSVCSGIEAASVAWEPLGFKPKWFSEIEPFPSAVLNHHWPSVINLGDMTKIAGRIQSGEVEAPEVLVGGTPCQAFSVAGARMGLADERGQLTISYGELADAIDDTRIAAGKHPAIIVWENVPGVLSSKDNAFGAFLGLLSGEDCELVPPGRKWSNAGYVHGPKRTIAWRVLDAQYFGVAQRRRRVFVVASAREGFDPAEVLFEREGVRRDTPPSREAGSVFAALTANGVGTCGADDNKGQARHLIAAFGQNNTSGPVHVSHALNAHSGPYGRLDFETETFLVQQVAGTLQANGKAAGSATQQDAEGGLLVVHGTQDPDTNTELAHTIGRNQGRENALFHTSGAGWWNQNDVSGALRSRAQESHEHLVISASLSGSEGGDRAHALAFSTKLHNTQSNGAGKLYKEYTVSLDRSSPPPALLTPMAARRLIPVECERLQDFPDGHTNIPWRTYQEALRKGLSYETLLSQRGMTLRGPSIEDCPDGPRYKAIGNSMAVCCMRRIGQRILLQLKRNVPDIDAHPLTHVISDDEHRALNGEAAA